MACFYRQVRLAIGLSSLFFSFSNLALALFKAGYSGNPDFLCGAIVIPLTGLLDVIPAFIVLRYLSKEKPKEYEKESKKCLRYLLTFIVPSIVATITFFIV